MKIIIVAAFTMERILSIQKIQIQKFMCDLIDEPKWISADSNSGVQLADLYAGILGATMIPDRFGNYEAGYLES